MKRTGLYAISVLLAGAAIPIGLTGPQTAQAASRTYYVSPDGSDGNPGTSPDKAFRTLQKAADTTAPGDTVSVMNGTYRERPGGADVVVISRSGRPGAPITYQAHPGHHPVVNPVAAWNGIRISGASHIVVRGLEVRGNSAGISLAEAERGAGTKDGRYNGNCIWAEPDRATGTGPHHITIVGNTVHHCPGSGIASRGADHLTIDRNHVHSTSWYSVFATSGISVLAARDVDRGDPGKYKIRVTGNVVHDNETKVKWERCRCYSDGNGIIIDTLKDKSKSGERGPDYQGRVLVANNVSYDNGGSGIHSFKSQHVDIVHNTAYRNGRSTRMESYANVFAHDSRDVRILNNVSYGRPGQATNSKNKNVEVTYDYNVYYGGLAPEVKGPHDIVADPRFVRPGDGTGADFRLREGSPAIGTGTPVPEVTEDITGADRAPGAPDRGAYTFGAPQETAPGTTPSAAPPGATPPATPEGGGSAGQPGEPATRRPGVQEPEPSGEAHPGAAAGVHSGGEGGGLAETGTELATPLGLAAAAFALGGGAVVLRRRKRS
ncbi:LPXTG cell wall anchor domain-containing protein [Streptomyces sp. SID5770]|uniref:right-handed parallel beta-helix repeat-containing protein n=1 Tax=Streptomyces sp. SID5770 TaxID=2690308 RepID=UPI00136D889B|nr:right-handed parallel beta-helix repeat-containing protein [Streptomyces sp. SID5770]MZE55797.1 LPXTG cell wall anchor domain-containing protein [Streptomyces sp. SID5770]